MYSAPDKVDDDQYLVHLFGIRNAISFRPMRVTRHNINQRVPAVSLLALRLQTTIIITVVHHLRSAIMAGATFIFAWLAYAVLFVSQAQAGWEMLSPGYMPKDVARRQDTPNSGGPRTVIDAGFGMHRSILRRKHILISSISQDSHGTTQVKHNLSMIGQPH